MAANKWDKLLNDEIYMLKRMAIEAGFRIMYNPAYSEGEKTLYSQLLNELIEEDGKRIYSEDDA